MKLIPSLAAIDHAAIEQNGIPGIVLMEAAGLSVAQYVAAQYPHHHQPIVLVCGAGNNGGDAYCAARWLHRMGYTHLSLVTATSLEQLKDDAAINAHMANDLPLTLIPWVQRAECERLVAGASVIVDGLFGSGLSRVIDDPNLLALMDTINNSSATVVAIDIPSGIDALTGLSRRADGKQAILARTTLTFGALKPGLILADGREASGQIRCVDIGLPPQLIEADTSPYRLITNRDVQHRIPHRPATGHKYQFGKVLVIGGSLDMPGALVMSAMAALRTGAGLVQLAAPASAIARMQLPPEIMLKTLSEDTATGTLTMASIDDIATCLDKVSAIILGPGLSLNGDIKSVIPVLLERLLQDTSCPIIVDADALNALSQQAQLPSLSSRVIITPHTGEAARILHQDKPSRHVLETATALRDRTKATVVLKSASTLVASSESPELWLNLTGNNGMATAGSGDVLAGIIAGLAAQGAKPVDAAIAGVFLHGVAGDAQASVIGHHGLTATHLIDGLFQAFQQTQSTTPIPDVGWSWQGSL